MKSFENFIEEVQHELEESPVLGGKAGQIEKARNAKLDSKSFLDRVTTADKPSLDTAKKAPKLNTNPNIKYSERDIDAKRLGQSDVI